MAAAEEKAGHIIPQIKTNQKSIHWIFNREKGRTDDDGRKFLPRLVHREGREEKDKEGDTFNI